MDMLNVFEGTKIDFNMFLKLRGEDPLRNWAVIYVVEFGSEPRGPDGELPYEFVSHAIYQCGNFKTHDKAGFASYLSQIDGRFDATKWYNRLSWAENLTC